MVSRSPGNSRSTTPSTSSAASESISWVPTSDGLAAPPSSPVTIFVTAKPPAASIATTAMTPPTTLPLLRLPTVPAGTTVAVGGPSCSAKALSNPGNGGALEGGGSIPGDGGGMNPPVEGGGRNGRPAVGGASSRGGSNDVGSSLI